MNLKEYLDKYKINPAVFAVRCGLAPASMYFYLRGRKPYQETAEKIEKESDGLVTVKELRGKDDREKRKVKGYVNDHSGG